MTLAEIVDETRRLIESGDMVSAMSFSGQAVAQLNNQLAGSGTDKAKSGRLLADLLFAVDNHVRILFTQEMFSEVFTTVTVALSQSLVAQSNGVAADCATVSGHIDEATMLLLADALAALLNMVESNPPQPQTVEADHLSALLLATASLLYHAYKRVLKSAPSNPDLHDVYQMLSRIQPLGAIRAGIDINGKSVNVDDNADNQGEIYGDMLGRAVAMGWFTED